SSFRLRRPLLSTLFPYTTLFRSQLLRIIQLIASEAVFRRNKSFALSTWKLAKLAQFVLNRSPAGAENGMFCLQFVISLFSVELVDRKSTRLNSSHVSISYAVFCL